MRGCIAALVIVLALSPTAAQSEAKPGKEEVVEAAREFGRALTSSDSSKLKPLLPSRGKVRLRLESLGPERGSYSAGQVAALLGDFLEVGSVASFELAPGSGDDPGSYTMVRGRASVIDRDGRSAKVDLHLTFEPEDGRWILREIRETRP